MTNHDCARDCILARSDKEHDYIADEFYAAALKDERPCLGFDGDIQSLGGSFGFDPAVNRAVAVDVTALKLALTTIYHADRLVKEMAE